jgi:hypothetical protein
MLRRPQHGVRRRRSPWVGVCEQEGSVPSSATWSKKVANTTRHAVQSARSTTQDHTTQARNAVVALCNTVSLAGVTGAVEPECNASHSADMQM